MKLFLFSTILVCTGAFASRAFADVATFSASSQNVTLTGEGGNAQGEGVSSVQWGTCAYDGKQTVCTVSAPYTGEGNGGTITFKITYAGNGPLPLTATSQTPGSNEVTLRLSAGSLVVTLTDNNGTATNYYETPNWMFMFVSSATCTGAVTTCSVGQVGLTSGATITGPVMGYFDTTPIIATPQGVISASAYGGFSAVSPGDWMEIYGYNLATVLTQVWSGSDFKNGIAPTALGGTTVTVGGQSAFIDYVSPGQVNAQVPSGVASGLQPVVVTTAGGSSVAFMMQVNATEPGLLSPGVFNTSAGQYIVALFPPSSSGVLTYVAPPGVLGGVPSRRAVPGDVITLYGVGFGPVTPDIPAGTVVSKSNALSGFSISFAGTPAQVDFAGLTSGYLGLYQFNVTVPQIAASDAVPITFTINGTPGTQTLITAVGK